jgi:hypothetical protein
MRTSDESNNPLPPADKDSTYVQWNNRLVPYRRISVLHGQRARPNLLGDQDALDKL